MRRGSVLDVPAGGVKTQASASTRHDCDLAIELEDVLEVL